MLENYSNQASGLLGLGAQFGPRMLAVVSHGDEQAELPMLWQLCMVLINFGYAVTVLDATTPESDANPGLAQRLDNTHRFSASSRDTPAWSVLAASQGLQRLCNQATPHRTRWNQLGQLFPSDSVVVLYSPVEWMIPLVAGTGIEPLLAVSQARTSLMTSYLALKRLLITGKLRPTIISMVQDHPETPRFMAQPISASLSECAKRFLGHNVKTIRVVEQNTEEQQSAELQRLALRLMENAVTLGSKPASMLPEAGMPRFARVDQIVRSH